MADEEDMRSKTRVLGQEKKHGGVVCPPPCPD